MEFTRICTADNRHYEPLIRLYAEAFPEEQRRSENDFRAMLENEPRFHCLSASMNGEFIGFVNYWVFVDFVFIEHFAIEPPLRGYKFGEKVISHTRSLSSKPLVLEVEPAKNSEWGERRIAFYNRLGFAIIPQNYDQPPYQKGGEHVPLHLMSNHPQWATDEFEKIKTEIYQNVYRVLATT